MLLFLTGCNKQRYVAVSDSKGIEEGAPVIWYEGGAYVGTVSSIKQIDDRFLIYIEFQKSYEQAIRAGVKACPLVDTKISNKTVLLLVGGKDITMPILEPGSQIPEISLTEPQQRKQLNFVEWFGGTKKDLTIVLAVLVVVLGIICVLKFVAKMVRFVLFIAIIAIIAFYVFDLSGDWNKYKEQASEYGKEIKIDAIQDWLQTHYTELKENMPAVMQNIKKLEGIREAIPGIAPSATDQKQPTEPQQPVEH